jgi:hypothetical protein
MRTGLFLGAIVMVFELLQTSGDRTAGRGFGPGARVLIDAHNCYPYHGRWADRITRALAVGLPVAIEQDLAWYTDPRTGRSRSLLSHEEKADGTEPGMREYFFERIRPVMERALREGDRSKWPLIVLNLDFKTDEPAHHRAVWDLLGEYEGWLCTAVPSAHEAEVTPMRVGPLLVLTGEADSQEHDFHDRVGVSGTLRVFGAVRVRSQDPSATPQQLVPSRATDYRRWWNNPWSVVEPEGRPKAGAWTQAKAARLRALVEHAHSRGLWIRFYTLNGHLPELAERNGWEPDYNFGSLERAQVRWRSAIAAGVDFLATDQCEELARLRP